MAPGKVCCKFLAEQVGIAPGYVEPITLPGEPVSQEFPSRYVLNLIGQERL